MLNKLFKEDSTIYIVAIFALSFALIFNNFIPGIIGVTVGAYLTYYASCRTKERRKEYVDMVEGLKAEFDSATKHAIFNMPFPLVMLDEFKRIIWYNTPFKNMVDISGIMESYIGSIFGELDDVEYFVEDEVLSIEYGGRYYSVHINVVNTESTLSKRGRVIILYFVEMTEYVALKELYDKKKLAVVLVNIDNYDDVKMATPEISRPLLLAEVDNRLNNYFSSYDAMIRKYESDKYLAVLEAEGLEQILEKRFDILDDIKLLNMGNDFPITLSIGVSDVGASPYRAFGEARGSVDIALGRGGDQAVVKSGSSYSFYGGKSKAMEKRSKVRARVIAHALKNLIKEADEVFIMGHKNPDMDSIGAGIGVLCGVKSLNKKGHILFSKGNSSIDNLMNKMKVEQPSLAKDLISGDDALKIATSNSLVILVDNHKPSFTEEPRLLEYCDKVVIIDHHRRGVEFLENPVLSYVEPYASSTCELVTEILSYMLDEINLTKFEAEAIMAGIVVDTKNFSFQTGSRTFEAASILKGAGADMTSIKELFRDDFDTLVKKTKVVSESEIYLDKFAIGAQNEGLANGILVAAQAADELLDIIGVEASFVLSRLPDDRIHISGRSLGAISVQIILETLGGGGHLTGAGAQLSGMTMEDAKKELIEAIDKYLKEGAQL